MRARIRFEYTLIERLQVDGWGCFRSAGSRGPFDVVAVNAEEIRFIQLKTTRDPFQRSLLSLCVGAVEDLLDIRCPSLVTRWLYLYVLRGEWLEVRVDDYENDRAFIRERLRAEILSAFRESA